MIGLYNNSLLITNNNNTTSSSKVKDKRRPTFKFSRVLCVQYARVSLEMRYNTSDNQSYLDSM